MEDDKRSHEFRGKATSGFALGEILRGTAYQWMDRPEYGRGDKPAVHPNLVLYLPEPSIPESVHEFNIRPGKLSDSLFDWGVQAHMDILFSDPEVAVTQAPVVTGRMRNMDALALLIGSAWKWQLTSDEHISLYPAGTRDN